MLSKDSLNRLNIIYAKVERLIEKNRILEQQLSDMRGKNRTLLDKVEQLNQQVEEIENKNVNLRMAKSLVEKGQGTEGIRKKLDLYVKEIDRCLELLKSGAVE